MEGFQTLKGSWPWPWPWIRPYGIPSCINHRPLPIHQISFKSKKLFVDGRTDGRTYGRTFSPSNIIRSTFGSRPKKCRNAHLSCHFPPIFLFLPLPCREAAPETKLGGLGCAVISPIGIQTHFGVFSARKSYLAATLRVLKFVYQLILQEKEEEKNNYIDKKCRNGVSESTLSETSCVSVRFWAITKHCFLYFIASFIHNRFAFKMTQSRRRLLPITRAGSLRRARARSGSPTARVYKQITNHTLFYKLNGAVQKVNWRWTVNLSVS